MLDTMTLIDRFGGTVLIIATVMLAQAIAFEDENGFQVDTNRTGKSQRLGNRVTKTGLNLNSCDAQSGYTGTCMTRFNCLRNGGTFSGYCGTYGVCCETNMLCGRTSSLKRTLIQTPSTLPTKCTYTFVPYSSNVCQIKVEMEEFRLQQPLTADTGLTTGDTIQCIDSFEVNGMILCGNNDGQHLYVPFDVSGGTDANVNLIFNLASQSTARWRLIVTQLECPSVKVRKGLLPFAKNAGLSDLKNIFSAQSSDLTVLAPRGCTQYFTERSGTFESFNYNDGLGPYMANLNYAICFQRQVGDSGIEFSFISFELPNQGVNNGYDNDCHPLIVTIGKADDYLLIPRSMISPSLQPTYFCGNLKAGIRVTSGAEGPFVIYFNSDQDWSPEDIGFQIRYTII